MRITFPSLLAAFALASCAGVPPGDVSQSGNEWYREGEAELRSALGRSLPGVSANRIILFVGDGLDIPTITAARILEGQMRGEPGEENQLGFETFPFTGLAKTYNTNQQTPDSAGTATAMLTGVKTKAGTIGLSEEITRGDCASSRGRELTSIFDLAERAGMATGIVTTARITHATPAPAFAHSADRGWEGDAELPAGADDCKDIALQLIDDEPGRSIDVILGGGRRYFIPDDQDDPEYPGQSGRRRDGRDLISDWLERAGPAGRYVWNRDGFERLSSASVNRVLGLFEPGHMQFETDRQRDPGGEPSLAEMTATAISVLEQSQRGYFLLVEAGRIDHAHHDGNAYRALTDTIALSDAARTASRMTSPKDTLIIVTADHGHTMRIVGYPTRGNPILGKVVENDDSGAPRKEPSIDLLGKPYTALGYINGPGHHGASDLQPAGPKRWPHVPGDVEPLPDGRADLSKVDTAAHDYMQEAGIPTASFDVHGKATGSETHSAGDVPVYASGPGAHLLTGVREQNYIFHVMRHVSGL